jgi:hypothetical protein
VEAIERSLYDRARGYEHEDVHISTHQGDVIVTPITKHYAPDPNAAMSFLKNKAPDKWKDKHHHEAGLSISFAQDGSEADDDPEVFD